MLLDNRDHQVLRDHQETNWIVDYFVIMTLQKYEHTQNSVWLKSLLFNLKVAHFHPLC